jgi:transcriptional regulator with XRE-family HTH domain
MDPLLLAQKLRAVAPEDRVVKAIAWCGVTQKEIASTIGVTTRMLNYLALGRRNRALTYLQHLRLANRLRLDPGFLAGLSDPVARPERVVDRLVVPEDWRMFADAHGVPVTHLIAEAVSEYMSATEAEEHGYDPAALAADDYPQVVMMPLWMVKVMWAKALTVVDRRIVTPDEDSPVSVYGRKDT